MIGYEQYVLFSIYYPGIKHDPASNHRNGRIAADFMLQALEDKSEAYPFVKLKTRLLLRQTTR